LCNEVKQKDLAESGTEVSTSLSASLLKIEYKYVVKFPTLPLSIPFKYKQEGC